MGCVLPGVPRTSLISFKALVGPSMEPRRWGAACGYFLCFKENYVAVDSVLPGVPRPYLPFSEV